MAIVNRLFEIRTRRGLTQEQVAESSGVSRVTVGRVDRDPHYRPKGKTMQDLARGLRVRIGDLFDDDEVTVGPEGDTLTTMPTSVRESASDTAPEVASPSSQTHGTPSPGGDLVAAGVTRVLVGGGVSADSR